jgi:hypothetical protein
VDGHRLKLELLEDDRERVRASRRFHLIGHDARYARSGDRRLDGRLRRVDSES